MAPDAPPGDGDAAATPSAAEIGPPEAARLLRFFAYCNSPDEVRALAAEVAGAADATQQHEQEQRREEGGQPPRDSSSGAGFQIADDLLTVRGASVVHVSNLS